MRPITLLVPVLPVLAGSLASQGIVSPAHFALTEAGTSNTNPLGVTEQLARYLQIHEDLPAGPHSIGGLSLRRNSDANTFPAFSIEADIFCSIPITRAAAPDPVFDNNHDPRQVRQVASRRRYDFGGSRASTAMAQDFDYRMPFDAPFTCDQRLCWEIQILGRDNGAQVHFDAVARSVAGNANPLPSVLGFGTGCIPSGRTLPFRVTGTAQMNWPNNTCGMTFSAADGPANALAISVIGFDSSQYAGLPLPFPFPGSGSGSSGTCFVHNDVIATLFGSTDAAGTYSSPLLTLPLHDGLHGATIFHHVWAVDAAANAAGLVTSSAMGRQLVAPFAAPAVGLVGIRGNLDPAGTATGNAGLIVRFD